MEERVQEKTEETARPQVHTWGWSVEVWAPQDCPHYVRMRFVAPYGPTWGEWDVPARVVGSLADAMAHEESWWDTWREPEGRAYASWDPEARTLELEWEHRGNRARFVLTVPESEVPRLLSLLWRAASEAVENSEVSRS